MLKQPLIKPLSDDDFHALDKHFTEVDLGKNTTVAQYLGYIAKTIELHSRLNVIKQVNETLEKIKLANTSKPEFASAVQRYMVALQSELENINKIGE